MDKHALRIGIFNTTLSLLRQGWYTAPSGRKVELPSVKEVMDSAYMVDEPFHVLIDPVEPITTEVRVENKDCVLAAKELIDAGYNPAMLNLADLYIGRTCGIRFRCPGREPLPFQKEFGAI